MSAQAEFLYREPATERRKAKSEKNLTAKDAKVRQGIREDVEPRMNADKRR